MSAIYTNRCRDKPLGRTVQPAYNPRHHSIHTAVMNVFRMLLLIAVAAIGSGCATQVKNPADPFEPLNRGIYQFNTAVDTAIAKPVARGYNAVMPEFGKTMVGNFFSNLDDLVVTVNDLLQLKFAQAISDGSRFVFNSTFGIFGLFEITKGLEKHHEDFGQTLGHWGVGSGPYLVLPFLGPSSLRDSVGLYADSQASPIQDVDHIPTRNQLYVSEAIKTRAQLLDQEKLLDAAAIDRYAFMRDAYLQHRKNLVYDGNPPRINYEEDFEDDFEGGANRGDEAIEPLSGAPAASPTAQHDDTPGIYKVWVTPNTVMR